MYSYTIGGKKGKKKTLVESNNRVVVRTKNARPLRSAVFSEEGKDTLNKFNVEVTFPEADTTILKAKEDHADNITFRDNARTVLKTEEELRFAGRVLMDSESESPVLYTENLFIKFQDSITTDECEKILADNMLTIKQKLEFAVNSYFVAAPENTGLKVFQIAEDLLAKPEVELCHPELIRKKSRKTIHANQWHLKNTVVKGNNILSNINADNAHLLTEGEDIIIAVIDDGFDIDNPEFNVPGKVIHSRNITSGSNDPRPRLIDDNHGTACAGVATASGLNASGVAPKAKLIPIRNASSLGSIYEANAFYWAVDHGADIISCSWGPNDGEWWDKNDPVHSEFVDMSDHARLAIEHAVKNGRNGKGCVIVFAAGNGNEDIKFDGYSSNENVIAVAACNDSGKRSVYSDFGDAVWCCFPSGDFDHQPFNHPEPLTNGIYTTDRTGTAGYNTMDNYCDDFGGTSSACPGVAGIAALILSANPELTWVQVKEIIKDSCVKIDKEHGKYDSDGHSKFYGYGRPDAEKAVKLARELTNNEQVIKILSAMVNPRGTDHKHEKVSIMNVSGKPVNLSGWVLNVKNKIHPLTGTINAGETTTVKLDTGKIKLSNQGASISLLNHHGTIVHEVSYTEDDAKNEGAEIVF